MTPLLCALGTLIGLLSIASVSGAHPQDGPHADLRIAVNDKALTWNIGMNLAFSDEIVDVGREAFEVLAPTEEAPLEAALLKHFTDVNSVVINGEVREPVVRQFTIGRADEALLPLFPRTGLRALTRFVCVLEYPAPDGVEQLEITWNGYPIDALAETREPGSAPAPMVIEAQLQAEGRVEIIRFLDGVRTVKWHALGDDPEAELEDVPSPVRADTPKTAGINRPLLYVSIGALALGLVMCVGRSSRKPGIGIAGLACIAGAFAFVNPFGTSGPASNEIDAAYARSVVEPLLTNAYQAFVHTDESVIYDLLARSASGDVLDRLYREVYSAMVVSDHDQARAIIAGVEHKGLTLIEAHDNAFSVKADWEATGSVYHWGHSHGRTYAYSADISVEDVEGAWRIVGLTITDQIRLGDDDGPDAFLPEGFEL